MELKHFEFRSLLNIGIVLFFIELTVIGYLLYNFVFPPVFFSLNRDILVPVKEVKQGTNVPIIIDYCKYTDDIPLTYFVVVDHNLLPAVPATLALDKGCHKREYRLNLAYSVPVGTYRVSMIKQYPYLVFAGKIHTYFSNTFKVIPNIDEEVNK